MAADVSVGTIAREVSLTQVLKQLTKLAIIHVKDSVTRFRNRNQPETITASGDKKEYQPPRVRKITAEQAKLLVLGHGSAEDLNSEFADILFRRSTPPDQGSRSDTEIQGAGDTPAEDTVRKRAV